MYNKITEWFSFTLYNTCIHGIRISLDPVWQHQANQQRGSDDGRVPSGREVHWLEIGEDYSIKHPKHDDERATEHGMRNGDEHGRKFTNNSKQDVNQGNAHKHVSAGDLWGDSHRKG